MKVPHDYQLRPDQVRWPLVWRHEQLYLRGRVPGTDDAMVWSHFGGDSPRRRLIMWGHDEVGVFYMGVRAGTPLHIDPKYTRYSHQLILRNDGWRLHGLEVRPDDPPLVPGTLYCLDTHSPHQVAPDPRIGTGRYWVSLVVDNDVPLTPDVAWACLAPRLMEAAR